MKKINDKVLIITGSKNRVSLPLLKWISDPVVLIEPQEQDLYQKQHPDLRFHVMPKNDMGFAYMMNQMVDLTLKLGYRYFVFTDDDVTGFKVRKSIDDKFVSIKHDQVRQYLLEMQNEAEQSFLSQYHISFHGQSWGAKKPYQDHVGSWGVHITDAKVVKHLGGFDESLLIFNDWELSARMIKNGYMTRRSNLAGFLHKMKSMDGGAQEVYKKKAKVKEAAERIESLYKGNCKVIWVPEHELHEVRFNFKGLVPS